MTTDIMKIGFVDFSDWDYHATSPYSIPMGGSQSAMCYLAAVLAKLGHEVYLFNNTSTPGNWGGVECVAISATSARLLRPLDALVVLNIAGKGVQLRRMLSPQGMLVLWTQQVPTIGTMRPLAEREERSAYDGFVFVSEWQRDRFAEEYQIDMSRSTVLRNAIAPAFQNLFAQTPILPQKTFPPVLAYTSTPFRGLDILIDIFPQIRQAHPGTILKVFSSKKVYMVDEGLDRHTYGALYQKCQQTEGVEYIGSLPQPELARELQQATLLAYPNTFQETSCIAVMEAMASGCTVVTSDLAALPETAAGFGRLVSVAGAQEFSDVFNWQFAQRADWQAYKPRFVEATVKLLDEYKNGQMAEQHLRQMVDYTNHHCTWAVRGQEWAEWLQGLSLWNQALSSVKAGNLAQAITACQQAIKIQPQTAKPYYTMAKFLLAQRQIDAAQRAYNKALEIDPNCDKKDPAAAEFHFALAKALAERKQLTEAIASFQRVLQLQPNYAEAWGNLGVIYRQQDKLEEGLAAIKKAIALNPNKPLSHFTSGNILADLGRYAEAVLSYHKAINIQPDLVSAHINLGSVLQQLERWDEAAASFRRAIELEPTDAQSYLNLVNPLGIQGDLKAAIDCVEKALAIEPNIANPYLPKPRAQQPRTANQLLSEKVCYSTRELAASRSDIQYIEIYPSSEVVLPSPQTVSSTIHTQLQISQGTTANAFVTVIPDGIAWGDSGCGVVITPDNHLLADISNGEGKVALFFGLAQMSEPLKIDGTVAFLSLQAGFFYYHWMVEVLPRLELLRRAGFPWDSIDLFVVNDIRYPFQMETLKLCGIPPEKIITSQRQPHIQAKRLLAPSLPANLPKWLGNYLDGPPQWACQFLRQQFLGNHVTSRSNLPQLLYLNRQKALHRRVVNEDEVIDFLAQFGFENIDLESLSVREQAMMLAGAKVIVAPHGGGLTNLVFCEPGTKVIEIFSPRYALGCYRTIAHHMNLDYYYLQGSTLEEYLTYTEQKLKDLPSQEVFKDMFVNIDALKNTLALAGVTN